ncbi:MAG: hypothetical protein ACRC30_04495 [Clostridium sp.]
MFYWVCERIKDFSGENERRENIQEIIERKIRFESEITELIGVLKSVVNIFDLKINIKTNKDLQEKMEALKQFIKQFESLSKDRVALKKNIELTYKYAEDYEWTRERVYKDTLKRGIIKQRIKTKGLNKELRKRKRNLEQEINFCRKKLEICKNFSSEETEIKELYEMVINIVFEIVEEKIIPELNLIEDITNYNKKIHSTNLNIIIGTGTRYSNKEIFLKNIQEIYKISGKICNQNIQQGEVYGSKGNNMYNDIYSS